MGPRHGSSVKTPKLTIGESILRSAEFLLAKGVETPRLDAELLLADILRTERLKLYLEWEKPLMELEIAAYREFIRRRGIEREPVARIVARRAFYGRTIEVAPNVFCPRPETEGLVEHVLEFLRLSSPAGEGRPTIFEIGTGSGCIILSIALEAPTTQCIASEKSPHAFALAKKNAEQLGATHRVTFREGEYFAGWEGPLHVVVSNPPYVRRGEINSLSPEVKNYDPTLALDGGPDGLDMVRIIVEESARLLLPGGGLFLEIGQEQGRDSQAILAASGHYRDIQVLHDFGGLDRYVLAVKKA